MTRSREPVLIISAVLVALTLLFGGMGVGGLGADNPTVALIGAWGTLATSAATAGLGAYLRGLVTPTSSIAAETIPTTGETVAGEASALPAGTPVDVVPSEQTPDRLATELRDGPKHAAEG